jgi:hypothetical protein
MNIGLVSNKYNLSKKSGFQKFEWNIAGTSPCDP